MLPQTRVLDNRSSAQTRIIPELALVVNPVGRSWRPLPRGGQVTPYPCPGRNGELPGDRARLRERERAWNTTTGRGTGTGTGTCGGRGGFVPVPVPVTAPVVVLRDRSPSRRRSPARLLPAPLMRAACPGRNGQLPGDRARLRERERAWNTTTGRGTGTGTGTCGGSGGFRAPARSGDRARGRVT